MKRLHKTLVNFGINLKQTYIAVTGLFWFVPSYFELIRSRKKSSQYFEIKLLPIFHDRLETSGVMSGHYFHQDLLVAQKIFKNNPLNHLDIGSSIYGFVSHVASFRQIDILDIRDNKSQVSNIKFKKVDLMDISQVESIEKYDSISCLHVIEHFGLGRYGDKIDFDGYILGLENIAKLQTKGGIFYFGTPIGKPRIYFNAHRVFDPQYILAILEQYYTLQEFHYVDDNGNLNTNIQLKEFNSDSLDYGCGIFIFKRK